MTKKTRQNISNETQREAKSPCGLVTGGPSLRLVNAGNKKAFHSHFLPMLRATKAKSRVSHIGSEISFFFFFSAAHNITDALEATKSLCSSSKHKFSKNFRWKTQHLKQKKQSNICAPLYQFVKEIGGIPYSRLGGFAPCVRGNHCATKKRDSWALGRFAQP